MEKNNVKSFTTLDSYLAGYLLLNNFQPELISEGVNKVVFSFDNTPVLFEQIQKYHGGDVVPAVRLAGAIKTLKSQIHSVRRGG